MKNKMYVVLSVLALCGCTREVYLQQVPCADCEPVVEEKCTDLTPQCCPELAMQTEVIYYQVYEPVVPVCPYVYTGSCQVTCRQIYQ